MFWPLLIIQIVVFGIAVTVLRRVLSRNFVDAATRLQDMSAEYTRRHEELKEKLAESEQQYQEQLSRAKAEAERIIASARQEADMAKAGRLEEARLESERIVRQGLESRDGLRKELEREMEKRSVERACELIGDALPADLRRDIQGRWLEELFHNGLAQFDRINKEEAVQEVKIVSALPLTKEQRELLHTRLKERLGRDLKLAEQVDDHLDAGLMITVGSLVFDGTLASRIRRAVRKTHEAS